MVSAVCTLPARFYRDLLTKRNKRNDMIDRDYYRELAEYAMQVLGEAPPSGNIVRKKLGACHKARICPRRISSEWPASPSPTSWRNQSFPLLMIKMGWLT